MIDIKPANLMAEIRSAENLRDKVLRASKDIILQYHGRHYRDDRSSDAPAPENHAFEWLATITPSIIYDNPKVNISSRLSGVDRKTLNMMQHGLNRWAQDVSLWRTLMRVWYDMAFSFGVIQTTMTPIPNAPGVLGMKPHRPAARRIAPDRFILDPRCEDPDEARFAGHVWKRDKKDLLNDRRFDEKAIKGLIGDSDMDKGGMAASEEGPPRNEILGYEIWIPEARLTSEQGYHGGLYTLGVSQPLDGDQSKANVAWIRKPRPFFGPASGPYSMYGVYVVPGQPYPLSPLVATHEQVNELNAHVTAAARSAARHKKFIAYEPNNQAGGRAVKNVTDGDVAAIPGIGDNTVREMEVGGVSKEQYEFISLLHQRRDRATGLNDAARGMVVGKGSATENAVASEQRGARESLLQRMYADATTRVLYSAAWYMWHSEFVVFPLGEEAAADLAPRPPQLPPESDAEEISLKHGVPIGDVKDILHWNPEIKFRGGIEEDFTSLVLDIQPYSMERVNESLMQRRNMEWFNLVLTAVPLMKQFPEVEWETLLDDIGQTMNRRRASEYVNFEALRGAPPTQPVGSPGAGLPGLRGPESPASPDPLQGGEPGPIEMARQMGSQAGHAATG